MEKMVVQVLKELQVHQEKKVNLVHLDHKVLVVEEKVGQPLVQWGLPDQKVILAHLAQED
jgi:hypothetical protein